MSRRGGRRQHLVSQASQAMQQLKWEVAQELGITPGADTLSRMNGSVGGEMVKRMVAFGEESISTGRRLQ